MKFSQKKFENWWFWKKAILKNKKSLFAISKTDRHLLRKKVRQRISVMKTNTLYVSRELAFQFTVCLEDNKNTGVLGFSLLRFFDEFWRNKWHSIFDVVKRLHFWTSWNITRNIQHTYSTYSLIQYKGYNSKLKIFDGVHFRKYLIPLPAFYLIIWLMKSPKNFEKIPILKTWRQIFFWGIKTYFGKMMLFKAWKNIYFNQKMS